MKLRSGTLWEKETPKTDLSMENCDAPDENQSDKSGKSVSGAVSQSLLDRVVAKGVSKAEDKSRVDNAEDELEVGNSHGKSLILEGINDSGDTNCKGLPLGSDVLDSVKDSATCPEGETEEEMCEPVQVESSVNYTDVGNEVGNRLMPIDLNNVDPCVKEEMQLLSDKSIDTHRSDASGPPSPNKEGADSKCGCPKSERIVDDGDEVMIISGDEDKKSSGAGLDSSLLLNDSENIDADADARESKQRKGKGRRGRKKKNAGNLKIDETNSPADTNDEIEVGPSMSLHVERQEEVEAGSIAIAESGEGAPRLEKRKRGRKRKNVESSHIYGDGRAKKEKVKKVGVHVSGRVLRPRTMTTSGSVKVVEGGGSLAGLKRKIKAECLDQTEIQMELDESTQLTGRSEKKLKRRGRPPKVQVETMPPNTIHEEVVFKKLKRRGRPPKVQGTELLSHSETMLSHGIHEEVESKKFKRRGRPPKVQGKELVSHAIQKNRHKDMVSKKLKRRGRPPKTLSRNLATHAFKIKKLKRMISKKGNSKLKVKDVKRDPKIHKMQKEDRFKELASGDQKNVKKFEENDDQTVTEGKQLENSKSSGGGKERRKEQQSVRDQIVSMLKRAGWRVELRPRQQREYLDAVYIDQKGRTHWSVTKAYNMLQKKIEEGVADHQEVSAFTPIPEEAMKILFRQVTKVRSDKNKQKKKEGKLMNKARTVIRGEASPRKKPGRKTKDGSKRKEMQTSSVRSCDKSSDVKVKGDKTCCEHGVKFGSSSRGRPKLSQEVRQSRKPRLLARSSEKGSDQDDGFAKYNGKRNLLSWMIDLGVILPGGKVQYGQGRRKKRSCQGVITTEGIQCSCCNKIMCLSNFDSHAGGKVSQTFENLYLESGTSLQQCLLECWRKEEVSDSIKFNLVDVNGDDPNDDTCNICGDGGDLICCDGCPSTFHQSCLDIQDFPSGDWHCIYCLCKYCGVVAGTASGIDDSNDAVISEMLSCSLCEEKFHQPCIQATDAVDMDTSNLPFCGRKCLELFERLQAYVGVKSELEEGFSWTLLQRSDVSQDSILHKAPLKVECNSKLAVAFSVMDECFVPIIDERSGINMIHDVVYNCGSNFRRLNYAGFFTAVLERGDELISAASIRIHGDRLAEMPFIGTRHMYRRQGMCRRLLDAIESALCSLGVGELVIPAIPELFQTWTKVFGFKPLDASKRKTMKCMSMIVFPFTDMLQKPLRENRSADRICSPATVFDDKDVECNAKLNDKNVSRLETQSSNEIDYKQSSADEAREGKDAIDDGQMEEAMVLNDGCSYPNMDATPHETGISANSHGANRLCDLNSSGKNATFQGPKATGPISSEAKADIPLQHVSSDSDAQSPDHSVAHEHKVDALIKSKQLPSSESFLDLTIQPSSMASVTCALHQSKELHSHVENGGTIEAKPSSLTSEVGLKNTFDLNLHPSAADTEIGGDSVPNSPQIDGKSFELSDSRSQVDANAVSLRDSEPCATQPLVLV